MKKTFVVALMLWCSSAFAQLTPFNVYINHTGMANLAGVGSPDRAVEQAIQAVAYSTGVAYKYQYLGDSTVSTCPVGIPTYNTIYFTANTGCSPTLGCTFAWDIQSCGNKLDPQHNYIVTFWNSVGSQPSGNWKQLATSPATGQYDLGGVVTGVTALISEGPNGSGSLRCNTDPTASPSVFTHFRNALCSQDVGFVQFYGPAQTSYTFPLHSANSGSWTTSTYSTLSTLRNYGISASVRNNSSTPQFVLAYPASGGLADEDDINSWGPNAIGLGFPTHRPTVVYDYVNSLWVMFTQDTSQSTNFSSNEVGVWTSPARDRINWTFLGDLAAGGLNGGFPALTTWPVGVTFQPSNSSYPASIIEIAVVTQTPFGIPAFDVGDFATPHDAWLHSSYVNGAIQIYQMTASPGHIYDNSRLVGYVPAPSNITDPTNHGFAIATTPTAGFEYDFSPLPCATYWGPESPQNVAVAYTVGQTNTPDRNVAVSSLQGDVGIGGATTFLPGQLLSSATATDWPIAASGHVAAFGPYMGAPAIDNNILAIRDQATSGYVRLSTGQQLYNTSICSNPFTLNPLAWGSFNIMTNPYNTSFHVTTTQAPQLTYDYINSGTRDNYLWFECPFTTPGTCH